MTRFGDPAYKRIAPCAARGVIMAARNDDLLPLDTRVRTEMDGLVTQLDSGITKKQWTSRSARSR